MSQIHIILFIAFIPHDFYEITLLVFMLSSIVHTNALMKYLCMVLPLKKHKILSF